MSVWKEFVPMIEVGFNKGINSNLIFGYLRERLLMEDEEYEVLENQRLELFYKNDQKYN